MTKAKPDRLPLQPLLHAYCQGRPAGVPALEELPGWGPRLQAIRFARQDFLYSHFLETATETELRSRIARFYRACTRLPLHEESLARRFGIVRHGLMHLLHGRDPLPVRLENCLGPRGPYQVAGLGPEFWGAMAQGLEPATNPSWLADSVIGLQRLGLVDATFHVAPASSYMALLTAFRRIQQHWPSLSAAEIDHFLSLVGRMNGRDLWAVAETVQADPVVSVRARLRQKRPLREFLIERGQTLASAQKALQEGLTRRDGKQIGSALIATDPAGSARSKLDWGERGLALAAGIGRLWETDDPAQVLTEFWRDDLIPEGGLWLPCAVLHLRDPQCFSLWIKVRSVEKDGRHDVTYPVEEGLLLAFAAEAARRPSQPHVLLIDEINRGNLPRLFGELLYLLEYRDQTVQLPYSRREFQLPANLYILGTMNASDRSIVLLDQALRRRFSIVEMQPDSRIVSA